MSPPHYVKLITLLSEPVLEPEQPASPAVAEPVILRLDLTPPAPARPKPTYRDRVTRDKPREARQMSLF